MRLPIAESKDLVAASGLSPHELPRRYTKETRVLLVEDNAQNQRIMSHLLERMGVHVQIVSYNFV